MFNLLRRFRLPANTVVMLSVMTNRPSIQSTRNRLRSTVTARRFPGSAGQSLLSGALEADASPAQEAQTPPVVAPPPGNPRFPLVDSLRAIAALAVLADHAGFLTGVNTGTRVGDYTAHFSIGVTIFFLISGFLLYRPFVLARFHEAQPVRVRDYARRRLLRIVPAYWLALTALGIYPGLVGVYTHDWWIYYGFLQIYGNKHLLGGITPAWSLCVEVTFYLMLPFFAMAMQRLLGRLSVERAVGYELAILAVLGLASLAFRVFAREQGVGWLGNTLPGFLYWFGLGMGIAVVSAAAQHSGGRPRTFELIGRFPSLCWLTAAVLYWVLCTQLGLPKDLTITPSYIRWTLQHVLYGLVSFFFVLPAMISDGDGGLPRRILARGWLAWIGLISYGIYLWHLPILHVLSHLPIFRILGKLIGVGAANWLQGGWFVSLFTLGVAIAGSCATVSYYFFERPILRYKDRRRPA
jgi:peptidoglycan/LPS O-acetylase OafA/YrhL